MLSSHVLPLPFYKCEAWKPFCEGVAQDWEQNVVTRIPLKSTQFLSLATTLRTDFLLLQTRVVCPPEKERNFHIFYQLLYGITQEERVKLHLQGYSVHTLSYLSSSPIPYNEDEEVYRAKFEQWRGALASLGIPFVDVLRILVAILLLGNVEFVDGEGLELDVKGNNGRCNNFKY